MLPFECVSHLSPATSWILQSLSLRYRNGRLSELSGLSIFCYRCLTLLEWHFISTCPLHPLPGWYDIVAELRLIRAQTGATLREDTCALAT